MDTSANSEEGPTDQISRLPTLTRNMTSVGRSSGETTSTRANRITHLISNAISRFLEVERLTFDAQIPKLEAKGEIPTPTKPISDAELAKYVADKQELLLLDEKCGYDCEKLSYKERIAEKKLDNLRQKMLDEDLLIATGPYWEKRDKIMKSQLYKCFLELPKPGVHHTHLTACADKEFLLKLTYNSYVFFSAKDGKFIVNKNL